MSKQYFGWDIGGAHLKIAKLSDDGDILKVRQIACPLWRGVGELSRAVALLDFDIDGEDAVHAVTMTGELCDVFGNRSAGVKQIVERLLPHLNASATVRIYGGYDGWLSPEQAAERYTLSVASANWLALGAFTAELIGDGVLVDVGSTTTDIIPIINAEVQCAGRNDASRLACEELVYTGVVRTPVIAVCRAVPFRGHWQHLAAEDFAAMSDVYRLLGQIEDRHDLMHTADNRGKDLESSARRLARMLGCDYEPEDLSEIVKVAEFIARTQRNLVDHSVSLTVSREPTRLHGQLLVGAGVGRFLVQQLARSTGASYQSFDALIGADSELAEHVSIAAPAVAVAKLAWMTN